MRYRNLRLLFVVGLTIGTAFAQEPAPASNPAQTAYIVRVRTGWYAGWCVGYCDEQIIIEPASVRSILRASAHRWMHPDRKKKNKITQAEWQDLQHSTDATVLAAFIGRIGCPSCTDSAVEWVTVEFSDGTNKSVSFAEGNAPPAIAPLLQKIKTLSSRLKL